MLTSLQTSAKASQIIEKGLIPMTLPLTSSSSLLRPTRNLIVRFCSTISLYSAKSSRHFQEWISYKSNCSQQRVKVFKYWVTFMSPCFRSYSRVSTSNNSEVFSMLEYVSRAASYIYLAVLWSRKISPTSVVLVFISHDMTKWSSVFQDQYLGSVAFGAIVPQVRCPSFPLRQMNINTYWNHCRKF